MENYLDAQQTFPPFQVLVAQNIFRFAGFQTCLRNWQKAWQIHTLETRVVKLIWPCRLDEWHGADPWTRSGPWLSLHPPYLIQNRWHPSKLVREANPSGCSGWHSLGPSPEHSRWHTPSLSPSKCHCQQSQGPSLSECCHRHSLGPT